MKKTEPLLSPIESLMIDVRVVAALIPCSERTVYRLADSGKMPMPIKLSGLVRWRRAEILEWINAGCPKTNRGPA